MLVLSERPLSPEDFGIGNVWRGRVHSTIIGIMMIQCARATTLQTINHFGASLSCSSYEKVLMLL
jgi:hypothetical protein